MGAESIRSIGLLTLINLYIKIFVNRKNMILMDVVEERVIDSRDYGSTTPKRLAVKRELSQAMIPGKHLVKVEIEKDLYETKMTN